MFEFLQSNKKDGLGPRRDVFLRKMFSFGDKELVKEEHGNIIINTGRPIGKGLLRKLLGSDAKIEAMFTNYSWFGIKLRSFFKFEFIKLLEEVSKKKYRYDVDREIVPQLLAALRPNPDEEKQLEEKDIDKDHIAKTFEFNILEHQEKIIKNYIECKYIFGYRGMLVHAGIGSGKTASALFLMEGLHKTVKKVIILCPLPTVYNVWDKTLSGAPGTGFREPQTRWVVKDGKPYNGEKYIVCHFDALDKLESIVKDLPKGEVGIVVDESHNLADGKSKRTDLALKLCRALDPSDILLLSGTPLKSGFKELATIFKFLDKSFDDFTEDRYYRLYRSPSNWLAGVLKERYNGYTVVVEKSVLKLEPVVTNYIKLDLPKEKIKPYLLSEIRKDLSEFIQKRLKEIKDNMDKYIDQYNTLLDKGFNANPKKDLSALRTYKSYIEVIKKTNPFHFYTIKDMLVYCNKFEKSEVAAYLNKEERDIFLEVKTIYKYPILKVQGEGLANVVGKARIDCHAMMAKELDFPSVMKAAEKKTVIFSNYIEVCNAAKENVLADEYKPITVYGDTVKDLAVNVKKFETDPKLNPMITTYKSLSTGVPLIVADTIICIDLPFRMYVYEQAIGRAWRLGQDKQVNVFILELNTDEPNINSRNIDIIKFFKEEVEKITGVKSSVDISSPEVVDGEVATESMVDYNPEINYDLEISQEVAKLASKDSKRRAVEDFLLKYIAKIVTGDLNTNLYRKLFDSMSNEEFKDFMTKLRDKEITLSIIVPNGDSKTTCNVENNLKIGKELGFNFFQKLTFEATGDMPTYTTPHEYMLLKLPIRRAAQLLIKKISIPKDSKAIDNLTGQVTGDSRSSKMSNPETQVLLGMGLKDSLLELLKVRGGDKDAANAMNQLLINRGVAHQSDIQAMSSGVESTKTLKLYFNGMHIKNTL